MSETCRGHLWDKIIVKLFASSWYILLTYIYDARSHLYIILSHCNQILFFPLNYSNKDFIIYRTNVKKLLKTKMFGRKWKTETIQNTLRNCSTTLLQSIHFAYWLITCSGFSPSSSYHKCFINYYKTDIYNV